MPRAPGLFAALSPELPAPTGLPRDRAAYLRLIDDVYQLDAYHSLSIEGYQVTAELVQRFPNLSVIDVDAVLKQVRATGDQVSKVVQVVFWFSFVRAALKKRSSPPDQDVQPELEPPPSVRQRTTSAG